MADAHTPRRIVVVGPGPQFKGGIAHYTTSLARALAEQPGTEVHIVSWTQQYPALIPRDFIDRASRQTLLEGTGIRVHYLLNYNWPGSWRRTYRQIVALRPEKVIVQWAIALQGLPLGYLGRWLARHPDIELVYDLHLVAQKEATRLDYRLTRFGIAPASTYIVHALKTYEELRAAFPERAFVLSEDGQRSTAPGTRTVLRLFHPVYDMFRPEAGFDRAAVRAELGLRTYVFLFFGFIRKYKGLHWCLQAFAELASRRDDVSLLIVGERFWHTLAPKRPLTRLRQAIFGLLLRAFGRKPSDEQGYDPLALIEPLGIADRTVVIDRFVPNEEVPRYFQVADGIVLFYEYATPSGVESIAANFRLPILATRVGHFPETVVEGQTGYLATPADLTSMAQALEQLITHPLAPEAIGQVAQARSWQRYAEVVLGTS